MSSAGLFAEAGAIVLRDGAETPRHARRENGPGLEWQELNLEDKPLSVAGSHAVHLGWR